MKHAWPSPDQRRCRDRASTLASRVVACWLLPVGWLWASAPFSLVNVTVTGNTATIGSGILNLTAPKQARIANVTVAGNIAQVGGASIATETSLRLSNAIVARQPGTPGSDCSGPIRSAGGNLASDNSCQFGRPGLDPGLASRLRRSQGSFTPVLALLAGSPAIDHGVGRSCPGRDQRGIRRPVDGDQDGRKLCDAGAFEYRP